MYTAGVANVWSFNTTVRNPERLEEMLRALQEIEGKKFDHAGQADFFGVQIKKRYYSPAPKTLHEDELIAAVHKINTAQELDDSLVARIVGKYSGKAVDAAGRGRMAAGILNRFGLAVARQSQGPVKITDLGKRWLNKEIDDTELFTKFLLKWQYPNPIEAGYKEFDIKPFVGVLSLVDAVNRSWAKMGNKPVGLSLDEYHLFGPSLAKREQIAEFADRIIRYRIDVQKKRGRERLTWEQQFAEARVREVCGSGCDVRKELETWHDYVDSSVRYFSITGLVRIRGKGTHVDLSEDRRVEALSVIDSVRPGAEDFASEQDYLAYLGDENLPVLPWLKPERLEEVLAQVTSIFEREVGEGIADGLSRASQDLSREQRIDVLREGLNRSRLERLRNFRHDSAVLSESIEKIKTLRDKRYVPFSSRPALDFEWYVARAMAVLNDAVTILPSYTVDDEGLPVGFSANKPDIECVYKTFGLTIEVTLLLGRDQWYAEGQPVMRHLRDFEEKNTGIPAYGIFVAPFIHTDTLETFWQSNKYGYRGARQRIIPLSIEQFTLFCGASQPRINRVSFTHQTIESFVKEVSCEVDKSTSSAEWVAKISEAVDLWVENA